MNNYIEETIALIDPNNILINRLSMLAEIENKTIIQIISETSITYLSKTIKPRKKDYDIYLESGIKMGGVAISNMQQGRKTWQDGTHGMERHLDNIIMTYGEDEINKNILKTALQLIKISIDYVFSDGTEKKKEKVNRFIQDTNFLYVMLQMAVKLIGIKLNNMDVDIENQTLKYMTQMIEADQKKIKNLFIEAIKFGDEQRFNEVVAIYYDDLNKYFINFVNRNFSGTFDVITKLGEEKKLMEQVGEKNIIFFIGILLSHLKNSALQLVIEFENNNIITIR
jgi:hypothetical protein|nr:MAG TPA: hypothetical protein [Caudoviricetes sp.]